MEKMDPQMVQRVFQRVRGAGEADPFSGLSILLSRELADCEDFALLSKRAGAVGELGRRLLTAGRRQCALLRGICRMAEQPSTPAATPAVTPERTSVKLRRLYGRVLERAAAYAARRDHPEYGCAFSALHAQSNAQACLLLELMDRLPQGQ